MRINATPRSYDPLDSALMFPFGINGWDNNIYLSSRRMQSKSLNNATLLISPTTSTKHISSTVWKIVSLIWDWYIC
jgi:hypothetical protein